VAKRRIGRPNGELVQHTAVTTGNGGLKSVALRPVFRTASYWENIQNVPPGMDHNECTTFRLP
jgi:hypothetical protein